MGSVAARFAISSVWPAIGLQTTKFIVFWDVPTRSGVRMQMIVQFWLPSKRSRKSARRRDGEEQMRRIN